MTRGKTILLAGATALALVLAAGCSLLPRENVADGDGWYIKLRVQAPAASKGITVDELDVTGMAIQVLGPGEDVLQSIDWHAAEGSAEYLVAMPQLGEYRLEVTHLGERDGVPVRAKESAAFEIRAMKITVIDVVPGGIGLIWVEGEDGQEVDLTGYWDMLIYLENQPPIGPLPLCLKQTGSQLDAQFGFGGFCPGSFDGENVAFEGDPGGGMVVSFSGKLEGEQIEGNATAGALTATFCMTRSTLAFGHWDIDGSYQDMPIHLNSEYAIGAKDDDPIPANFILRYWDTELNAYLWFNVVGEELEAGRTYSFPGEAWGSLHWSYHTEDFERDFELGSGTLHIDSCTAEGITGFYDVGFAAGGSISGSFDVSFVEDW